VLDRLQQSAQLSSIPVIVLTARDPQYNRERTLKAGASAFLQKPADNNELMDVIRITLSPVWPGTAASAMPGHRPAELSRLRHQHKTRQILDWRVSRSKS
jgi:CheY-like chemotaxis protein